LKNIRQRYILFEIITPNNESIEKELLIKTFWKQINTVYGEQQAYHVGLWMIRYDPTHRIGILRCDNIAKMQVIAALALLLEINKIPVLIHTWKTSGTIKKTIQAWRECFPGVSVPNQEVKSTQK
jgi:RNase P/RNase MRP subunit POP5